MSNIKSKDSKGRILVNGVFKVCNKPVIVVVPSVILIV